MTSLVIYVLPFLLSLFAFNQLTCSTLSIFNDDHHPKKATLNTIVSQLTRRRVWSKDKFLNLDNQLTNSKDLYKKSTNHHYTNHQSKNFNEESSKDDLFLDNETDENEDEKNDDQISGSGDRLVLISEQPEEELKHHLIRSPKRANEVNLSNKLETKKRCSEFEFECWNGKCIERRFVCDGRQEDGCSEGEDELNCTVQRCNPTFEVQCKHENKCVNLNQLCDGIIDCIQDASDEENCECEKDEFQCRDRTCINSIFKCDHFFHCRDGSDELDCACKTDEFRCDDSQCIPITERCDSIIQCRDASDENNCSFKTNCKPNEFECVETRKCINSELKCNGYVDCPLDFSDEMNCFNDKEKCKENEFRCRTSGRCIDRIFVCDHIVDCDYDQSDEDFCWRCRDEEFTCRNGQCILEDRVCNGIIDCFDGTDEKNCTKSFKKSINLKDSLEMSLENKSTMKDDGVKKSKNNLMIDNLPVDYRVFSILNQSPNHHLKVREGFSIILRCTSTSINIDTDSMAQTNQNHLNKINELNQPINWFKLDQTNFIKLNQSTSNVSLRGGRLIIKHATNRDAGLYLCRSKNHQLITTLLSVEKFVNLDELMLNDDDQPQDEFYAKESSLCKYNEFACGNNNQCVLRINHCDGFPDCQDRSDEIGCSPPMIVQSPDRQVISTENDNVTLSCKAIGTPTPVITWKLNWEAIRSTNPRLITASNNGYGTLTIKNVQQSDSGKYACEARNNLDKISAPYDSELIIKSKNGVCLPPTFNDDAKHIDQCIQCFCFNQTSTCYSSNLKIQTIPMINRVGFVQLIYDYQRNQYRELPVHPLNQEKIVSNPEYGQFILNSSVGDIGESIIYWNLPHPFTGNLIRSYAGFLKYIFNYATSNGSNSKLQDVDIIIKNDQNNLIAYHSFDYEQTIQPISDNQIHVRLIENQFSKDPFSRNLTFNRADFLTLLQNVTHFYVRAKYDRQFEESKIRNVELDVAVEDLIGNDHLDNHRSAKLVEKCSCPLGYTGTSCESCSLGYVRSSTFQYGIGSCVREVSSCTCHGNSNFCDPFNRCYNCQNNSEGFNCERCKRGYFGDPRKGIRCQRCDCPNLNLDSSSSSSESNELTIDEEWLNGACVLAEDNVTSKCVSCPLGTQGSRCQDCAPNYYRDSQGRCRLTDKQSIPPSQQNGTCRENQFQCDSTSTCIPISFYCNGFADCPNGSDETNCVNSVCDPFGSYDTYYNRKTRKCDCKPSVSGLRCDHCKSNSFHLDGKQRQYPCTKCYCMGVSNRCVGRNVSSNVIELLNPESDSLNLTTIDDISITDDDGIYKLGEFDTENSIPFLLYTQNPIKKKPTAILYWKLPQKFLGNQLSAYGGELNYKLLYKHLKPDEQLSYSPDVVLVGRNQEEIHYKHPDSLQNTKLTKIKIDLIEDSFSNAKGEPIRKDQLMNALFDLDRILIKASYTKDIVFTGIKEIQMITSNQIESCECPQGYTGDSCDQCSEGYFKKPESYYHQCIPCDCNNNSKKCDQTTGRCLECEYNFEGDRCDRCKNGFILSRTRGFNECIDSNLTRKKDNLENRICNDSVEGLECDRCRMGFYNLKDNDCTRCSCSSVTDKCRENYGFIDEIELKSNTLQLKDKEINRFYTVKSIDDHRKFTFSNLPKGRSLHWQLPAEFLGDQVRSYGYNLSYQLEIDPIENNETTIIMNPDVEMSSRNLTIVHMTGETTGGRSFSVPMKEDYWERVDNLNRQIYKINKLEFLRVLSDLQEISIRAIYHENQQLTSISNVKLITTNDDDSNRKNQQRVQTNIEQCICPIGYEGSSCERCSLGFTKNSDGLCVKCRCNGHSEECRFVTNGTSSYQECLNCLHSTQGRQCEQCIAQFYGDATLKTPTACKPCPCPSIRASGNFASSCKQHLETGNIICNCEEGYSGNSCETCAPGYERDTSYPGRCKISIMSYRNRTPSYPDFNTTHFPDATQTIVTSTNTRLRIDPNHLLQHVRSGETVLIRCVAQLMAPNPKEDKLLSIIWIKEGDNLPPQSRQTSGILEIPDAQIQDSGIYYCLSNDPDGTVLKLKANLIVIKDWNSNQTEIRIKEPPINYPPQSQQLNVRVEPRILNVKVGDSIFLKCIAQSDSGPIEISWYKSTSVNEFVKESRHVYNGLVINSASLLDSGDYYCEGRNSQGRTHSARSRVIVSPIEDSTPDYYDPDFRRQQGTQGNVIIPPSIHIIPERQTIIQNSSGRLICLAKGNPTPKIVWSKAHAELDLSRHLIINEENKSTLEIRNSTVSDRGLYVCRAENSGGMTQQSSIVEIERREIPAIEIYPSAIQMLAEHSSALFQCRLTAGIPTPTIEWKKTDGTELADTSDVELLPGGVIRFTNLRPEHQGRYICTAYNQAGRVKAEALLHVQGSINVRIKQTGPYRVRTGDRVKLDCNLNGQTSVGVPEYRVEWRKMVSNSSQIQIPYISVEENKASLIINSVSQEDSGHYICSGIGLQNNQIIVQERIQLIVEPPNDPFESVLKVEDRVVRASIDQPIEIRCFVRNSKDKIVLNWFKRDSNLPLNSRVEDGVLYIDRVTADDEGIYVCTGKNDRTKTTEFTENIRLAISGFYGSASPKILITPALQSVKSGDQVRIRCQTDDEENSRVHWTKLNSDDPRQSIKLVGNQDAILSVRNQDQRMKQVGDTLIIDDVGPDDQGYYLCTAVNKGGQSESTAEILVTDSDNQNEIGGQDLKSKETNKEFLRKQKVQAGHKINLKCPIKPGVPIIDWSFDFQNLPENAIANQYSLTLSNARKSNEGRYYCIGYDEKGSISGQDYVDLIVKVKEKECRSNEFSCNDGTCIVNELRCNNKYDCHDMSDESDCDSLPTTEDEVELGGTLILSCELSSRHKGDVKWFKMNGKQITQNFSDNILIDGSQLTINNIRSENGGIYRCMINDTFKDSIVTIKVQTKSAPFGTSILMHCKSNVIKNVQNYHWKRVDSPLPDNALTKNNQLTIRNLNEESAGIYICIARNQTHRVEIPSILRVTHIIPQFTGQSFVGLKHYSSLNSNEIDLSFKIQNLTHNSLLLFSGNERKQDFLAFIISNQHLEVKFDLGNGVVTLKSHGKLELNQWHRLKFKRHHTRALLEIDDQPEVEHIQMNYEKSVGLNLNNDLWFIGGYKNYTHLIQDRKLSITSGLNGCISQLRIDQKRYILIKSAYQQNVLNCDTCNVREQKLDLFQRLIDTKNHLFTKTSSQLKTNHLSINQHIQQLNQQLTNISTMIEMPNSFCKNGGICQEAINHEGVKCICKNSFTGLQCEKFNTDICLGEQCGPGGRCVDLNKITSNREQLSQSMSINKFIKKQQNQFCCDCGLGREGERCQKNITIEQPRFTGQRSFMTYSIPRESSSKISILIKLKITLYQPDNEMRDGLILYSAEKSNGIGDFISLSIKNQKFQFQFNTGSGVTIIESDVLTSMFNSTWFTVRLIRDQNIGRLILFDDKEYIGQSPGSTKGINLRLPLYVGDIDEQLVKLPASLNDSNGFIGCVNKLEINNQTIDLINHSIDSLNVKNCKSVSICSKNPCKNNGICSELSTDSYRCTCRSPFSGTHCEKNSGICSISKPCHNKGRCLDISSSQYFHDPINGYKCCCIMGFSGRACDIIEEFNDKRWSNFDNSKTISYLTIENLIGLNNSKVDQTIELTFNTERFNGLLFYQGDLDFTQNDYLMMNLNDGYLEIEWQLGSGIGLIRSEESLNDGRKHQLIFKRKGQEGQLIVDISNPIFAKSIGSHTQLNADNYSVHIGGHKEIEFLNKLRPSIAGFSGCIGNLRFNESNDFLDLSLVSRNSCNIRPCD